MILLDMVKNEAKLHAWQELVQSELFRQLIKGIREAMPCHIPVPEKCVEGYLGAMVGKQTTRDAILDTMFDPDNWIAMAQQIESASVEQYDEIIKHLEEDSVFWKDQKLTGANVRQALQDQE